MVSTRSPYLLHHTCTCIHLLRSPWILGLVSQFREGVQDGQEQLQVMVGQPDVHRVKTHLRELSQCSNGLQPQQETS